MYELNISIHQATDVFQCDLAAEIDFIAEKDALWVPYL
jgi:hypothetical protein